MRDSGHRALLMNGAVWVAVAKVAGMLIALVSTTLLARMLAPADFGLVGIASTVAMIVTALTELSLAEALVQREELSDGDFDTAWTLNLLRAGVLAALIAALSYPVALVYDDSRLTSILLVMAMSIFISGFGSPRMVIFQRRLDFSKEVVTNIADKVTAFMVGAAIAIIYQSYWALVLGVLIAQTVRVALSYFFMPYRPRFTLSHRKHLLGFSVWLTLGNWIQSLNWRSDPLVLGYFLPNTQLGYYSLANRISAMSVSELIGPIEQVLFPAYARIKSEPHRLHSAYLRAQGVLCTIAFPLGAGIAILADPLVQLALGAKWLPAVPAIQVMVIVAALQYLHGVQPLAMATGNTKALFARDLRAFLVRVPLLFGGIYFGAELDADPAMGMLFGALIGGGLAGLIDIVWNMRLVSQFSTISMREQFGVAVRPALASAAMSPAVELLREHLAVTGINFSSLVHLVALILAGVTSYFGTLALLWLLSGRPEGTEVEVIRLVRDSWKNTRNRFCRMPS